MDFQLDNLLAQEIAQHLTLTLKSPLTCNVCLNIDGRFSNIEYAPVHIATGSKFAGSWIATLDIIAVPSKNRGEKSSTVSLTENDLLPWNITNKIMWPKYPHLFRCFTVPNSEWLECLDADIDYPVRAQAVKLHRGVHVMPVGVRVTADGVHCYILAVEKGGSAFDSFSPTVMYPIGSFAQQTTPVDTFDVAGWA